MKPITVVLAEDHPIVREGLRHVLQQDGDIKVVGEAVTGREAVALTRELLPEVVVMDIAMPLLNGLEATRQICRELPTTRVLILSAHDDDEYVVQALALGAAGYLVKQTSALTLAQAVREVYKGKPFFSASIATRMRARERNASPRTRKSRNRPSATLTSREVEILQLIAEGRANKESAAELGISIKTVEKHRQHLMSKLNIHNTAGLTRYAISAGIISSGVRFTLE